MKQMSIFLVQLLCIAASDYLFGLPGIAAVSFIAAFIIILVKEDTQPVRSLAICTAIWSLTLCFSSAFGNGKMMATKTAAAFGLPHSVLLILATTIFAVCLSASLGIVGAEAGRILRNQREK